MEWVFRGNLVFLCLMAFDMNNGKVSKCSSRSRGTMSSGDEDDGHQQNLGNEPKDEVW